MEKFIYQRPIKTDPKINIQFFYPAIESFAMASLGFLTIFQMLDSDPEIYVERVYLDSNTTLLQPKDAEGIGFSISFELDILSVIKMLKKYNIPIKANERSEDDPIIFSGGPVLMSNPIPFENIFDFISIGEKTSLLPAMEILKEAKENNLSKDETLKKLAELEGIYVPKYKKEKINIVQDKIENDVVYTSILSDKSFFKDTFVIELERGCPRLCNFCLASFLNHPTRFCSYDSIIKAIDLGLQNTSKIALLGAAVASHPDFNKIIQYIAEKTETQDIELSISSLRADMTDIELIKTLVKCNQKTATIALEAGSQRLRDYINKNLSENQILNTLQLAHKGGLKGLKIYNMIGLPTETDADIEEFIILAKKMKDIIKQGIKEGLANFELTFSFSTFIPKCHTPFELVPRADKKTLEKRISYLKKNFHQLGINFRCSSVEWDMVQGILSRYDSDLVDFLIDVVDEGGNLGAFKKVWRTYTKRGHLQAYEKCCKYPFSNIKAPKWRFIKPFSSSLKDKRLSELEFDLI